MQVSIPTNTNESNRYYLLQVVGWFTAWKPDRPFAMDMAGFAVNVQLVHKYPEAKFSNEVQRGYQESTFLTGLKLTLDDLEPRANMCTEVMLNFFFFFFCCSFLFILQSSFYLLKNQDMEFGVNACIPN